MHRSHANLNDRIHSMALVLHGTHRNNTYDAEHLPIPYIPHRLENIDCIVFGSERSRYMSNVEDLVAQMCT